MINKKQLIVIFMSVFLVVLMIIFWNIFTSKNQTKSNDNGGPPTSGLIDPKGELLKSSTTKDYYVFQDRIIDYLLSIKTEPSAKVVVTSVTTYERDGTKIDFIVDIPSQNIKGLKININYVEDPYATFNIPSKNYSVALYGGQS